MEFTTSGTSNSTVTWVGERGPELLAATTSTTVTWVRRPDDDPPAPVGARPSPRPPSHPPRAACVDDLTAARVASARG